MSQAGLPDELKWHTLRHTVGSRLAASGASKHQIMLAGGWESSQAVKRYIHLYQEDLQALIEQLSRKKGRVTAKKLPT